MEKAHENLPITKGDFEAFCGAVIQSLKDAGVMDAADLAGVNGALFGQKGAICNQPGCLSFCEKYAYLKGLNDSGLVTIVVDKTVEKALASPLKTFFDGTTPAGSTDFTAPANAGKLTTLKKHLVEFFGAALGCSDASIPEYEGVTLKEAHAKMPITKEFFNAFNDAVIAVLTELGVDKGDLPPVRGVLDGTEPDVCTQPGCNGTPTVGSETADKASGLGSVIAPLASLIAFLVAMLF